MKQLSKDLQSLVAQGLNSGFPFMTYTAESLQQIIYCFCTTVSQLCILFSRPCVPIICDSELISRVPWFGFCVVSDLTDIEHGQLPALLKKTQSPFSFSFCLFLVTCLWTRKFNKKNIL